MNKNILITRGILVFPNTTKQLEIGREKSLLALNDAFKNDPKKEIVLISQIDPELEDPKQEELYQYGTLCEIKEIKDQKDGSFVATFKGLKRIKLINISESKKGIPICEFEVIKTLKSDGNELMKKMDLLFSMLERIFPTFDSDSAKQLKNIFTKNSNPEILADKIIDYLQIDKKSKIMLISEPDLIKRYEIITRYATKDEDRIKVDKEVNAKINEVLNKQQKEFYLREKMRVLKEELGQLSSKEAEENSFRKRINENPYPENIKKRVITELNRMEATANPQENALNRAYVEWLLDLPYWQLTTDNNDIKKVAKFLNKSHYGLEKVKERIIEYLAVKTRSPKMKGPIMCLVGPPGVGKTSLAKSIAEALNKKFVKMSLGGVRDEAEIRGHRKTYLGSMPGRIIKGMKNAGVANPLFLLDEIDKMTSDMRGDPSSALLEVLDPEQNNKFSDNYIEEDYDLSKVMFIATANYAEQIPEPLYDRLEIIELTSYTEREKLEIAKKYLIPKIFERSNLTNEDLSYKDEAINYIIRHYTREAGVRELERQLEKIARKFVVRQQHNEIKNQVIDIKEVKEYLKKEIFDYNTKETNLIPGVVNGMAYTTAGGDLLPIEVTYFDGKGNITITGNLKETMKESANVALGYVKANAKKFGLDKIDFQKIDIHIHVPSGGIPKDGPSAGVTLTTAIISALSGRTVKNTIAMTGEITLRGRVLIIGGVKEKVISAYRGGVNEIFMPSKDERYLDDVPNDVLKNIKIHLVDHYDQIYKSIFKK